MEKQYLNRKQLVRFHTESDCAEIKRVVIELLNKNILATEEDKIEIDDFYLKELYKKGTQKQKDLAKEFKLILEEDLSVNVGEHKIYSKDGSLLMEIRRFDKYRGKGFFLAREFDWDIMVDEQNILCLVPTLKKY